MLFDMLFPGKRDGFLRNAVNKHHVIYAISTDSGGNAFHSYDNIDIDITKLSVQSSAKCFKTVIGENKVFLRYCYIMQTII